MFGALRAGYWLLLAAAALQFCVGYTVGLTVGDIDPSTVFELSALMKRLPAWLILPLGWFGYVAVFITLRRVDRPLEVLRRISYRNRYWLLRGLLFTTIAFPLVRAYPAFKSSIPHILPFYADPYFVAIDRAIFGTDPWRLTHALIGSVGTMVLDRIYVLWFFVTMALLGWLNFTRNQKLQLQGLLTFVLSWGIIGNLMALAFASAGPCFYEHFYHSDHFSPLMAILRDYSQDHRIISLGTMAYLLDSIGKDRLGSGISAMPSMHVVTAFLFFLVIRKALRSVLPKILAGLYVAMIVVGSVHLGWHYAVDGIVGIAAVTLIWLAAGRFVDWLEKRPEQVANPTLQPAL
jgi:hypothetical protein